MANCEHGYTHGVCGLCRDLKAENLQTRHDALVELVRQYFDAKANLKAHTNAFNYSREPQLFNNKLQATHAMVIAEAELRKAAKGE